MRANQPDGSPHLSLWHMHALALRSLYGTRAGNGMMSAAIILVSDGSHNHRQRQVNGGSHLDQSHGSAIHQR